MFPTIFRYIFWVFCLLLSANKQMVAQDSTLLANLVHEKWKYAYQIHVGNNQTIHTAILTDWSLYFSLSDTLYMQMGNITSRSPYTVDQQHLISPILPYRALKIISCQSNELILAFQLNEIDLYYLYFRKQPLAKNDPIRPNSTLNSVSINYKNPRQHELSHQSYLSSIGRKGKIKASKKTLEPSPDSQTESQEFLQIELTGGGFRGGVDPVYRNILLIRTDGSLLFEYETKSTGLQTWKKKLHRDSLNSLITYIENKNFFNFEKIYSCRSSRCFKRLAGEPTPIALRLCITKGSMRKVVSVAIWDGQGRDRALIDYPLALDDIVRAIQLVADISVK